MFSSEHPEPHLVLLGRAVRRTREERGISVDQLARASAIHRQRILALETGHLDPTYEQLLALADALGVQPSALVVHAERMDAPPEP